MMSQDGLQWEETLFDVVPKWTRDPSITAIEGVCRRQLGIAPEEPCGVAFHASGLFNKLYLVDCAKGPLIMRVSLPVYPGRKTRAEVATLRWVRQNSDAPVPEVYGFDDSNANEIGFEWILMELMQGSPANKRWRTMSMDQKAALTRQLATFQAQLIAPGKHEPAFRGIGTLQPSPAPEQGPAGGPQDATPGPMVYPEFFMGERLRHDVRRGPFRSSHDWLCARLDMITAHHAAALDRTEDEDDREEIEDILDAARRLRALAPKVFSPAAADEPEPTGLHHHDLHLNNILVDDRGAVTAVLDWECVSALPLWLAGQPPKFLDEPPREQEPQPDAYADEDPDDDDDDAGGPRPKNELYYIHRMEYEATRLRPVYEAALREHWPGCRPEGRELKLAFDRAVSQCDGPWVKQARIWAAEMEEKLA